jgi:hypothetical protein
LKQHKPWFGAECLGFFLVSKQEKMQWVQDPSQSSVDNLNAVRLKASRHFRNKKKEYLKAKIEIIENKKHEMGGACSTYGGEERHI